MRKMMMFGLAGALLLFGCGDAGDSGRDESDIESTSTTTGDQPDAATTTDAGEDASSETPESSLVPSETSGPVVEEEASSLPKDTVSPVVTEPPVATEPPAPEDPPGHPNPLVAKAVADLAVRLGVAQTEIAVQSFESVTWPNGAMGCPQPGMQYTQVMTDGARTILEYGGVTYAYHSGGVRDPFLCENPDK